VDDPGAAPLNQVDIRDSQGVQVGSGNIQYNLFAGPPPPGPVVAGNVPQAPPAFQPREDLLARLRARCTSGRWRTRRGCWVRAIRTP
jgi:hypothetical protein